MTAFVFDFGLSSQLWDHFIPYSENDLVSFFESGEVSISRVRFERDRRALFTLDVFFYNHYSKRRLVLQFISVYTSPTRRIELPFTYRKLVLILETLLVPKLQIIMDQMETNSRLAEQPILIFSFSDGSPSLESAGENRVGPGFAWNELYIHSARRYINAAEKARGLTILDLGCGIGYGSKFLAKSADTVIAVDVDNAPLTYGEETYPDKKIHRLPIAPISNDTHLPFASGTFDAIVNFEVIEHVPTDQMEAYFADLARVLKPNGFLMMSTPNKKIYINYPDPHHVSLMTLFEFQQLLHSRFKQVDMFGQERSKGLPHTSLEFQITPVPLEDHEVFIGICQNYRGDEAKISVPPTTNWISATDE